MSWAGWLDCIWVLAGHFFTSLCPDESSSIPDPNNWGFEHGGAFFSELAEAQISLCFKLCVQHCWPIYPLSARCADLLREEVTGAMVTLLFHCICMRLYNSWGWNLQSFDWCITLSLFASVFPNQVMSWSLFGWGQPRSLFQEIAVLYCFLCNVIQCEYMRVRTFLFWEDQPSSLLCFVSDLHSSQQNSLANRGEPISGYLKSDVYLLCQF